MVLINDAYNILRKYFQNLSQSGSMVLNLVGVIIGSTDSRSVRLGFADMKINLEIPQK